MGLGGRGFDGVWRESGGFIGGERALYFHYCTRNVTKVDAEGDERITRWLGDGAG